MAGIDIPYTVCSETAIQSFQFKIFHRFYPCQYMLSLWYKDQNPMCTYCNTDIDYIEHTFHFCPRSILFWKSLQKWWYNTIGVTFDLAVRNVIFGINNTHKDHPN